MYNMNFSMPMFNSFVPERIRPWIYLCIALSFQISGARYLGALNEIIGSTAEMREDVLMCLYCNLAGMAVWFPMLFRMKFRFTNKTLLTGASIGVIVTNLLIGYVTWLPLLWLLCFLEGIAKIQGTFECMSNIQLWMYSKMLGLYVADGFMRYTSPALWTGKFGASSPFAALSTGRLPDEMLLYGVKSIYGWACYACVALILGFFLFDSPIRRHRSYMLPWRIVGEAVKKYYNVKSEDDNTDIGDIEC